jgi:hypothetical protein
MEVKYALSVGQLIGIFLAGLLSGSLLVLLFWLIDITVQNRKTMKMLLFVVVCLAMFNCSDDIDPQYRAEVLSIEEKNGKCIYTIGGIVPYVMPTYNYIEDYCGKYVVGQVLYF